jgi:hypothetical protein
MGQKMWRKKLHGTAPFIEAIAIITRGRAKRARAISLSRRPDAMRAEGMHSVKDNRAQATTLCLS